MYHTIFSLRSIYLRVCFESVKLNISKNLSDKTFRALSSKACLGFDASANLVVRFYLLCSCYVGDFRHSLLDIFVNCRLILIYFNN
jgi:hypothetical protein